MPKDDRPSPSDAPIPFLDAPSPNLAFDIEIMRMAFGQNPEDGPRLSELTPDVFRPTRS